jgi:hypothetical protein
VDLCCPFNLFGNRGIIKQPDLHRGAGTEASLALSPSVQDGYKAHMGWLYASNNNLTLGSVKPASQYFQRFVPFFRALPKILNLCGYQYIPVKQLSMRSITPACTMKSQSLTPHRRPLRSENIVKPSGSHQVAFVWFGIRAEQ